MDTQQLRDLALGQLALIALGDPHFIPRWLRLSAHLHHYAPTNQVLLTAQCPEAKLVAGFAAWKPLGRHVMSGMKAVSILRPEMQDGRVRGFGSAQVFHDAQTVGRPLPLPVPQHQQAHVTLLALAERGRAAGWDIEWVSQSHAVIGRSSGRITIDPLIVTRDGVAALRSFLHILAAQHAPAEQTAVAFALCAFYGIDRSREQTSAVKPYDAAAVGRVGAALRLILGVLDQRVLHREDHPVTRKVAA